jgi:hypothetical protein
MPAFKKPGGKNCCTINPKHSTVQAYNRTWLHLCPTCSQTRLSATVPSGFRARLSSSHSLSLRCTRLLFHGWA